MFRRPTIFLTGETSFCESMRLALRNEFDVVGSAHEAAPAVPIVARLKPDLVVMDVEMPMLAGIEAATRIRESAPPPMVIFVAATSDGSSRTQTTKIGALGVLVRTHSLAELSDAITNVLDEAGITMTLAAHLTSREREVVQLLAEGKLMKQVADQLKVSTRTVAFHKYGVMKKFGLHSSAELVRMAVSEGLVA